MVVPVCFFREEWAVPLIPARNLVSSFFIGFVYSVIGFFGVGTKVINMQSIMQQPTAECSTVQSVLLPTRVVQALNLNLDRLDHLNQKNPGSFMVEHGRWLSSFSSVF